MLEEILLVGDGTRQFIMPGGRWLGLVGLMYGAGINLQGMMARGASDYSFITVYITEWTLVLIAGLVLAISGARKE